MKEHQLRFQQSWIFRVVGFLALSDFNKRNVKLFAPISGKFRLFWTKGVFNCFYKTLLWHGTP